MVNLSKVDNFCRLVTLNTITKVFEIKGKLCGFLECKEQA